MTALRQLGSHSSNRMNGKRSAGDMISRGAHWLARSIPFELTAFPPQAHGMRRALGKDGCDQREQIFLYSKCDPRMGR
jgi:hypothetical protein